MRGDEALRSGGACEDVSMRGEAGLKGRESVRARRGYAKRALRAVRSVSRLPDQRHATASLVQPPGSSTRPEGSDARQRGGGEEGR
eukprot:3365716-Rhodomonas_salina.2